MYNLYMHAQVRTAPDVEWYKLSFIYKMSDHANRKVLSIWTNRVARVGN